MMAMMNIEHQLELPTARSMARTSYRVHVWCKACLTGEEPPQQARLLSRLGDAV
jgi:hypothetical protein